MTLVAPAPTAPCSPLVLRRGVRRRPRSRPGRYAAALDPAAGPSTATRPSEFAVAPDGSALVVASTSCSDRSTFTASRATYRPARWHLGRPGVMAGPRRRRPSPASGSPATPARSFTVAVGRDRRRRAQRGSRRGQRLEWVRRRAGHRGERVAERAHRRPAAAIDFGDFASTWPPAAATTPARLWQQGAPDVSRSVRAGSGAGWSAWRGRPRTRAIRPSPAARDLHRRQRPVAAWQARPGRPARACAPARIVGCAGSLESSADLGTPSAAEAVVLGDLAADGHGDALTALRTPSGVAPPAFDAAAPRFTRFRSPGAAA